MALDDQALERLLTDLGEDVDYLSANEYCGYLHAKVRKSEPSRDALGLIIEYDDHYGKYFETHSSTWTLHFSDWTLQSLEGTVPEKEVVTLPPGIGEHYIGLKREGQLVVKW